MFFVVVLVFLLSVYCLCYEELGNITGSRDKKPIYVAGRERSRTNFLYHFLLP